MKRIISMAVVLVITMAAMAQKGELAMNENISGKDNASKNEKEATPVGKKSKAALPENGILSSRITRTSMM